MLSYIIKLVTLIVFWSFTIFSYYKLFPFHVEAFPVSAITVYFIPLVVIYAVYKILSFFVFNDDKKEEVEMSYASILGYWVIHLLLLCIAYFAMKDTFSWWQWVWMFFKIIFFLILPITIFSGSYGFWNKILSYIKWFEKEEFTFKFLSSLWFWFFSFIAIFYILAFAWLYNMYSFFVIILWFIGFSYKEIWKLYYNFFTKKITITKDINLYTSEFLFVIITALISTNLILVFRPFPIGWDDLWVYMNVPNLFAAAWKIISVWGMQAWELYTWIGFIFWSSTQAFYLNTFSWIIASLVIYLFTKSFLNEKNEFINIPLTLVAIFLSMPMVIFQLGKDMKLDIWLFSISVIWLYMIYYIFVKKEEFIWEKTVDNEWMIDKIKSLVNKQDFLKKEDYFYIFIAWIIIWFAFTIKLTTIIFISAIIWVIIFNRIWLFAFLWYLAIYFAIFTKFWLWGILNVVYPKDNIFLINTFSIISFLTWSGLLALTYFKHKKEYFIKTFSIIWIFLVWIIVALLPWLTKNLSETWFSNLSIWSIISWKPEAYMLDYTKIHSEDELKEIEAKITSRQSLDENWQASNADLWRYFGYDKWINNYLKIPYSLSMQTNQKWEYTDITYIFLALIPVIFLFIPLKKNWYYVWIYVALLFEILYFMLPGSNAFITSVLNNIELPLWYAVILWLFIIWLLFFKYASNWKQDKILKLFIANLVFTIFYVFLWDIAAYWIVWYGITMYMCFLLFIWIWLYYITRTDNKIDNDDNFYIIKVINFFAIFIIISLYFVKSSIPHIFSNFNEDSYMHYKAWILKEDESIFAYHADYLNILFELNLKEDKKVDFIQNYKKEIYDFFAENNYPEDFKKAVEQVDSITKLNDILSFFVYSEEMKKNIPAIEYQKLKQKLSAIRSDIYKNIVSPDKESKSDAIIYRMWTFLKYFITENNYRLIEDSLIFIFDDYVYNKDINKTIDNFKKLGMTYIIVDLNTPTIDKDPTHALTNRFENLLKTFTSQRLELIDTDSMCLKIGIELYNKTNKSEDDLNNYVRLAWVNFESYDKDNKEIWRTSKLIKCYDVVFYLIDNNLVDNTNFPYLLPIKEELKKQTFANDDDKYKFLFWKIPAWFKAIFKITK